MNRARRAYSDGAYEAAWLLTMPPNDHHEAVLHGRAAANFLPHGEAARVAQEMSKRFPLTPTLHLLEGAILSGLGRDEDAIRALRRAVYLDGSGLVARTMLGELLRRSQRDPGGEGPSWP